MVFKVMSIKPGDLILFYIDSKRKFIQRIEPGKILGTDKGVIRHDDVIGRRLGEQISTSRGFKAYLLKPLPVDFLSAMRRVTQVIYPKDVSLMVYLAGVSEGVKVLEGGVGTGHVTAVLAYLVGEKGRVFAVDVDEAKLKKAMENLDRLGLMNRVVFIRKDIREWSGERDFDAAILDVPDPWNSIRVIHESLKPSSPLLVFLPTINQVEKTVAGMKGLFTDIHVYETLVREYLVLQDGTRPSPRMIGHTGFIVFGRKII
jgi:tRNA (adenine57-N1/adenine58-N1)-methyltransferase